MSFSPQQDQALKAVAAWLQRPGQQQVFRLFGYAGTGKTTLAREIAGNVNGPVMFGAFTGKAAHVLQRKGCDGASTIHSMIYRLEDEDFTGNPTFKLNREASIATASLVIIDEVSMVDEALGRDLLSFRVPVLVLGDPAQLPPVRGQGFFTDREPDVMLTEVHRQAEGSPIIRMATTVRQGGKLEAGTFDGCSVISRDQVTPEAVLAADQVLVGLNRTRHGFNNRIRVLKGIDADRPQVGEKLVCLKNDRIKRLLNGSLWTVSNAPKATKRTRDLGVTRLEVLPEDSDSNRTGIRVHVKNEFWTGKDDTLDWQAKRGTEEFTYGYALTCHKSQGSQWDSVMVFDESGSFRESRKEWLYTAITRAATQLTVVQ